MENRYKIGNVIFRTKEGQIVEHTNVVIAYTPSALIDFIEEYEYGQQKISKCFIGSTLAEAMFKEELADGLNEWSDEVYGPFHNIRKGLDFIPGVTSKIAKLFLDEKVIPPRAENPTVLPIAIKNALRKYPHTFAFDENDQGVSSMLDLSKRK